MITVPQFRRGDVVRAADLAALTTAIRELQEYAYAAAVASRRVVGCGVLPPSGRVRLSNDEEGSVAVALGELLFEGGDACSLLPARVVPASESGSDKLGRSREEVPAGGAALAADYVMTQVTPAASAEGSEGAEGAEEPEADTRLGNLRMEACSVSIVLRPEEGDEVSDAAIYDAWDALLLVEPEAEGVQQVDLGGVYAGLIRSPQLLEAVGGAAIVPSSVWQPLSFNAYSYRTGQSRWRTGRMYWTARLGQHGDLQISGEVTATTVETS